MKRTRLVVVTLMAGLFVVMGCTGCATVPPVSTVAERPRGTIAFQSMALSTTQFLRGARDGTPVVISGELSVPSEGTSRLPAVILLHGSWGVGPRERRWVEELTRMGMATFLVDSFSGRGIRETATDQRRLSSTTQILDAYRALDLLSTHPRIDPARIVLMGFSRGGIATLYASLIRFQRLYGSAGADLAAYLPSTLSATMRCSRMSR